MLAPAVPLMRFDQALEQLTGDVVADVGKVESGEVIENSPPAGNGRVGTEGVIHRPVVGEHSLVVAAAQARFVEVRLEHCTCDSRRDIIEFEGREARLRAPQRFVEHQPGREDVRREAGGAVDLRFPLLDAVDPPLLVDHPDNQVMLERRVRYMSAFDLLADRRHGNSQQSAEPVDEAFIRGEAGRLDPPHDDGNDLRQDLDPAGPNLGQERARVELRSGLEVEQLEALNDSREGVAGTFPVDQKEGRAIAREAPAAVVSGSLLDRPFEVVGVPGIGLWVIGQAHLTGEADDASGPDRQIASLAARLVLVLDLAPVEFPTGIGCELSVPPRFDFRGEGPFVH